MEQNLTGRPRYTDRIVPFIGNGNIKILTGIRRCGKSSVMRLLSDSLEGYNILYLNMEYAENYDLRDWKHLLEYVDSNLDGSSKNALFIDEVQDIDGWDIALRDLVAKDACDIYITGSNSNLLSSEYSTRLGGRFNQVHMLPLSYSECRQFMKKYGGEDDAFQSFIRKGGFPILWRNPTDIQSSMQTIRDLVEVSIARDIEDRYAVKLRSILIDILRFVLSVTGKYVTANNIYNTLRSTGTKVSVETVYQYIDYLEAANIIIRADVFDIKGKRILASKHKYYTADLGIKHAVLGYRPEDTPAHMENIVFTELLSRGYDVYVGDYERREVDFVAVKGDTRLYVQVCQSISAESTFRREFGNLEAVKDSFPKYVVMMDPGMYEGITDSGIVCCKLEDFLLRENL